MSGEQVLANAQKRDQLRAALDETFSQRVAQSYAPASAYAVFDTHAVRFTGEFGEARPGQAVDSETRFRVASCTKSITAVAVLRLRDAGKLSLDQPITDFVPAFRSMTAAGYVAVPTVRMLLTMSGGLPTDDPWGDRQEAQTTEQLLAMLTTGVRLITLPGTAFEYSNLGYAILGYIVEVLSGVAFIDYVEREIFAPLGLKMGFSVREGESRPDAMGYRRIPSGWEAQPFSAAGAFSPIGGLFAAPTELARWCIWLNDAFRTDAEPHSPLSRASRREMQQIHRVIHPEHRIAAGTSHTMGYGFGLFIEHDPIWGTQVSHSGGYPGFTAHMRWSPSAGVGVVATESAKLSGVPAAAASALRYLLEEVAVEPMVPAVPDVMRAQPVPLPHQTKTPTPLLPLSPAAPLPFLAVDGLDTVWRDTVQAAQAMGTLMTSWSDELAQQWFAMNVTADIPAEERRMLWAAAIEEIGGLVGSPAELTEAESASADSLIWFVAGERGKLRCEIRLIPLAQPQVQTFLVQAMTA